MPEGVKGIEMNGEFVCMNLYVAAALCAHGADYQGSATGRGGRAIFRFADPDDALYGLQQAYFRGQFPPIQPVAFVTKLMELRDQMTIQRGQR